MDNQSKRQTLEPRGGIDHGSVNGTNHIVYCRSDSEYAERPTALIWQGKRLQITEIIARWRTPEGKYFRVCADVSEATQNQFILHYDEVKHQWHIQPQ